MVFVEFGKLTVVRLLQPKKALGPMDCNWELLAKLSVVRVERPLAGAMLGGVAAPVPSVIAPTCWNAPTLPRSRMAWLVARTSPVPGLKSGLTILPVCVSYTTAAW